MTAPDGRKRANNISTYESRDLILKRIRARESVTIREVADLLNCSYENARKLIAQLETSGHIRRGLIPNGTPGVRNGVHRYYLQDNPEIIRQYQLAAVGLDLWKWMGQTLTREEMKRVIEEEYENDNPNSHWRTSITIKTAIREFHNLLLTNEEYAVTQWEAQAKAELFQWLADSYKALADNAPFWAGN